MLAPSHSDIIRFRLLMISAGYEDGIDANSLRSDPDKRNLLDQAGAVRAIGGFGDNTGRTCASGAFDPACSGKAHIVITRRER
jgi:hypothetical protein